MRTAMVAERARVRHEALGWPVALTGALLLVLGSLLSWDYDNRVLGDLSLRFNPAPLQLLTVIVGVVAVLFLLTERGPLRRLRGYANASGAVRGLGLGAFAYMVLVLLAIATLSDGLVNVNEGGWTSLVASLVLYAGGWLLPEPPVRDAAAARTSSTIEILVIVVTMAVVLFAAAYALARGDGWTFFLFLVFLAAIVAGLVKGGFTAWFGHVAVRNRRVLTLAAFAVAFFFPFTQNGSDANMSIATQILIFAATAMGLNIVVGLAGLLDLGYIAFLGSGAYVSAAMSTSAFATVGWKPPFLVVMLIGACVAATFGLIIGTPTLRVSGDYLAIVTLAFGEIFRLAMFNLDGNNGPNLTNGPNAIPGIPDLKIGSFSFGDTHTLAGIPLGRFSNYYFVLLLLIAFVITVFARLNNSRIGRGWVAIREDEKAAEAMGVNVFGLKVFAFAAGAFLAGLAGTIKAHQDGAASPDQYVFLESAFLLAAIVLGGMGTIAGVLVGATILKLLPEKLREIADYRLMVFGLLLVLMMRFRPEGLVANKRRQLEFHEEDQGLAEEIQHERLEDIKGARLEEAT